MSDFLFYAFATGSVLGAIMMVTRRNPVSAVILLVGVFFSVSGMFLMLDAHYIAAINVILYGGAIMVLFLFVIMLLNQGHATWNDMRGPATTLLAGSAGVAFLAVLSHRIADGTTYAPTVDQAGQALRAQAQEMGIIGMVARPLFTDYAIVLQVTGVLLLAAMVGTIVLARKRGG
ncbi:MAG: NADH-quinone oxidoreductase subunit J [Gemmatimonadetes bacterium]|nr:NADH-quinone oxidoreductase subunit J [Gemmatimonadota bacterium]